MTTDAFRDSGALVKTASGVEIAKSTAANPKADFAEIINAVTDSNTSFWEQGLENSYQAVFKYANKFSRSGVPLIVVYVTDEDDYSCKDKCWGVEPENNTTWVGYDTQRYIDFFKKVKASEGSEAVLFPIVGISPERCVVPTLGKRYELVASAIGLYGTTGSICDLDMKDSYNNIAKVIADRDNVFVLDTPATGQNIKVYVDSEIIDPVQANFSFDPGLNAIVFNGKLPKAGSVIEVLFEEKK